MILVYKAMVSMRFWFIGVCLLDVVCGKAWWKKFFRLAEPPPHDAILYSKEYAEVANFLVAPQEYTYLKRLWIAPGGKVLKRQAPGSMEVAATAGVTDKEHNVGAFIVSQMTSLMPEVVFRKLASSASVGLFTSSETTTIFPEYAYLRDRPECKDTCWNDCSVTCTQDGRKYDSLSGVGGARATCINVNFMCSSGDPYHHQYSVLVHEFAHTVHTVGLSAVYDYYQKLQKAYDNAKYFGIWDRNSYGMSNVFEYFAEGSGVFFHSNKHPNSCGDMNRCGRQQDFCRSQEEARDWLSKKDPMLFKVLSYTYTNFRPQSTNDLQVCVV